MRFLIITNAPTLKRKGEQHAYAPYVNEMDIWFKHVDDVVIVSPTSYDQELLLSSFKKQPKVVSIPSLNFTTFYNMVKSVFLVPKIAIKLAVQMKKADHIHLRCPGNIGLIGCFVQILFPKKMKTAKYAGNWNPEAKQPRSYQLQKKLLSNTMLTKNIQVLVYGDWKNQTKNIKAFFTATFKNFEIEEPIKRNYNGELKFVFIGSLVKGKRPLLSIKIVEELCKQGKKIRLDVFGDGTLKEELQDYVNERNLEAYIVLHGNREKEVVKKALKTAHFLILPSKSEGWPKVVAEAMFFGTIPIVTQVSCVPYMLGYGKRGILIEPKLEEAVSHVVSELKNAEALQLKAKEGVKWSQHYTLDLFESEIAKLVKSQ